MSECMCLLSFAKFRRCLPDSGRQAGHDLLSQASAARPELQMPQVNQGMSVVGTEEREAAPE